MTLSSYSTGGIVDVTSWQVEGPEEMGKKRKFWVVNPIDSELWLFKSPRIVGGAPNEEDWPEVAVAHVAQQLDISVPITKLAVHENAIGVISRDIRSENADLEDGYTLLSQIDGFKDFDSSHENPHYTIPNVLRVLQNFTAPSQMRSHVPDGGTAWLWYIVLDALVANTDRHPRNWGTLRDLEGNSVLAASFDHGSSLGFSEPDAKRTRLTQDADSLTHWVGKGICKAFAGKPKLLNLAKEALESMPIESKLSLLAKIEALDFARMETALAEIPLGRMSEAARRLCIAILRINQGRLQDVCSTN